MYEYDEECLQAFLEQQGKLFDEPVADTLEEAEAFLEDCMAAVVNNIEEVKEFLEIIERLVGDDLVGNLLNCRLK